MPSYNRCCSGKAINITYSECVFVALRIQHSMRMRHIVTFDLSVSTIFSHVISQTARFSKKNYWTQNVCFDFLCDFVSKISHSKKKWERYDQKCISVFMWSTGYYCQILMKLEFSRYVFEKYPNIKFNEYPSSGRRVVPREWTHRHIDMTKVLVAFRNYAIAPSKDIGGFYLAMERCVKKIVYCREHRLSLDTLLYITESTGSAWTLFCILQIAQAQPGHSSVYCR
jgi:hypothetical protein